MNCHPTPSRKRPRYTHPPLDLVCTSALSSPLCPTPDRPLKNDALSPNEFSALPIPVDDALAALDAGLGLNSSYSRIPIEQELAQVIASLREKQRRAFLMDQVADDASCVSDSGGLGQRVTSQVEDSSKPENVLLELQEFECFANTTATSPPLCKRRREQWVTLYITVSHSIDFSTECLTFAQSLN